MSSEARTFWVGVALGSIGSAMIVAVIMAQLATMVIENYQQNAVSRGYAEWRLTHAHNGDTEFTWLDKPSPPTPETAAPLPADP